MRISFLLLVLTFCLFTQPASAESWNITLSVPETIISGEPVVIKIPETHRKTKADWKITCVGTAQTVPAQRDGDRLVCLFKESLPANSDVEFFIESTSAETNPAQWVTVKQHAGVIEAEVRDKKVFAYRESIVEAPEGLDAKYRRSGYLHPVWTPSGKIITGDFAKDHPHQHGVFFAWTNTKFQGRPVNFWDQLKGQGRIEHRKVIRLTSGPVFGEMVVKLGHVDLSSGTSIDVLEEFWRVRIYNSVSDSPQGFLIDFESKQTCVANDPLEIQKYHYGGMAIRGNTKWLNETDAGFRTNEGKSREEGNHSRPLWCDIYGPLDGAEAGLTMISSEENFLSPQPVRLHPKKPYFCWAPLVLGPFNIEPEQTYESQFRFWIHDGKVSSDFADQLYRNFNRELMPE